MFCILTWNTFNILLHALSAPKDAFDCHSNIFSYFVSGIFSYSKKAILFWQLFVCKVRKAPLTVTAPFLHYLLRQPFLSRTVETSLQWISLLFPSTFFLKVVLFKNKNIFISGGGLTFMVQFLLFFLFPSSITPSCKYAIPQRKIKLLSHSHFFSPPLSLLVNHFNPCYLWQYYAKSYARLA